MKVNEGDLFIYKSKYGGITKGIVFDVVIAFVYNTDLGCVYKEYSILSENKIPYLLSEIILIDRYLTPKEIVGIKSFESKLK